MEPSFCTYIYLLIFSSYYLHCATSFKSHLWISLVFQEEIHTAESSTDRRPNEQHLFLSTLAIGNQLDIWDWTGSRGAKVVCFSGGLGSECNQNCLQTITVQVQVVQEQCLPHTKELYMHLTGDSQPSWQTNSRCFCYRLDWAKLNGLSNIYL